jgi:hypothetical protein
MSGVSETLRHPVDEADVALLDALHVNPLASFERLGRRWAGERT